MAETVKLSGFKELDRELGKLSKAVARGAGRRALVAAAEPMARLIRQLAPDNPATFNMDRDLRESIEVSARAKGADAGKAAFAAALSGGGSRGEAVAALKAARAESAFVEVYVGPRRQVFHGLFQEFGTVNHPPQPFMRPAWDQDKHAMLGRLRVELADEIGRALSRAGLR
ncbi:phage protein, HK97 gp10 family [Rhodovulum sp. ES.010]|uniref:HK97-gp10 family putative phage morphogenesis protein n=1 Tax=Rhodovulum sp. ES.010 TaxID=1882821 RepID=UPI00092A0699|nr:HK97-gp10 family putative phage morphogenesis protein [Rhodovulum sp. ES.010]SIO36501.1 phage protein, HK97 gp10 family [Rhodovulum sp. ES.010]